MKKDLLKNISIAVVCALVASIILLIAVDSYLINQAEKNIENLLLSHKGIHQYVQQDLIPSLAKYKKGKKIVEDFYAPELFSSSYIVRMQHQYYNQELKNIGHSELYYKMAAKNPRNAVNQASEMEVALIDKFNRDRSLKRYSDVIKVNGARFLYTAIPFLENKEQCLNCHGKREAAPRDLQARYADSGGWEEKLGEIRAITSIMAPLEYDRHNFSLFIFLFSAGTGIFALAMLALFNRQLSQEVSQAVDQIKDDEKKFRNFLDSTASAPWELDLGSGKFTMMGAQIEVMLGYPTSSWKHMDDWTGHLHPEDREGALAFCKMETAAGRDHDFIYRMINQNGSVRWIRDIVSVVSGKDKIPSKLVGFMQDITAQKELEADKERLTAQLVHTQKLEAIGTLAGGIAHDFNNILSVILGHADLAKMDVPRHSNALNSIEQIRVAGKRAADLVRQILTFSRQSSTEKKLFNPSSIIKEALKMLRASIPSTIDIVVDINPNCGLINANPTQLHQVVMNVCTNAFHAMEKKGGILRVEFHLADDNLIERLKKNSALLPGKYLEILVSDTGHGIRPEIIHKIFDPFFTTKEQGKGTGLGLSSAYGIIKDLGGMVTVESEVDKGSSFHILIPICNSAEQVEASEQEAELPRGNERLLFVDDEPLLLEMGKSILERFGYSVTACQCGLEALELFIKRPADFDLVITDQTMPGMTGFELAERIIKINSQVPIILCTGHSEGLTRELTKRHGIVEFALKPLTREMLAKLVREALDSKNAGRPG
ncbi:MAG: hypothetical protein A2504_07650 [Bdellovibrionales bacterium RIFOXYD12_FULL_39_22]|nr:MAG: hypothetical protein A2385_10975 [Bdellovibrionales bacterium RIFOXYB1_FULL_39_21]OFZ41295.1 MAG: hypothetical protein A2485_00710 [Bdellovibrionales bacterium RIFOXYC12_FULL_39_17]OFZ45055.1 MAG: hypothetical protein A2404_11270 [Bdellovibrionales bacterium RIFOXYC1_FULL_39_130]OFZ74439.1 MAG: hypothetical protein A2560_11305 [Bdellovibrionales bacterium RIFOXYD1_FULL_39_84]OFZ92451.1 MAG: hypothetical protein A2504_07650 [Bdellovibrionales bacterium RIFOXYD12_FULL_39_22]HLE12488.1 DU